jgi:hypothetical protein
VRPEGRRKEAVDAIAGKVLGSRDPGRRIRELIDQALRDSDAELNYDDDVEPWLGRRAAVALTSVSQGNDSQVAVIIAAKDTDKARDTIEKLARQSRERPVQRDYQGVEYRVDPDEGSAAAVVDDFLVFGTEAGLKAVIDASKGEGLDDNEQFKRAAEGSEERLGFGYVDTRALVGAVGSGRLGPQAQSLQSLLGTTRPVTMVLDATSNKVTLEAVAQNARGGGPGQSPLVAELPGDSWAALGIPQVGQSLRRTIEQLGGGVGAGVIETLEQQLRSQTGIDLERDALAAIGDVALFVRGAGIFTVGGGAVIESPDPAAARRLLSRLGAVARRLGPGSGLRVAPATVDGARGVRITAPGQFPGSVFAVLRGDRLVVAYTEAATREALSPDQQLGNSPEFQKASASLGDAPPSLYVAFEPIANLAAAANPENAAQIRQYLGALISLAAGSRVEGNRQVARLVVNLR